MKKIAILLCVATLQLFGLELGKQLSDLELENNWTAKDMDAKVNVIFYVDPDMKDLNDDFAKELQKLHLSDKELKVFVIINMQASWIPNMLINTVLESKQKKFPEAHYVKDKSRVLVKKWALKDDDYDIVAVDADHKVFFSNSGKLTSAHSNKLIREIENKLYTHDR